MLFPLVKIDSISQSIDKLADSRGWTKEIPILSGEWHAYTGKKKTITVIFKISYHTN